MKVKYDWKGGRPPAATKVAEGDRVQETPVRWVNASVVDISQIQGGDGDMVEVTS
jgi:hypothetical protein